MRGRESSLMKEIERGALDSKVPLADTLRKCLVLGGRARSAPMRDWANRELKGYGRDDELPEWRKVAAPILFDGVNMRAVFKGMQISPTELPDFARDSYSAEVELRGSVGELEAALRESDEGIVRMSLPGGAEMAHYINLHNSAQRIDRFYWGVSTTAIYGVLDQIRTALTVLVAELRDGMPDGAELPSPEVATNAAQFIISGKRNRVVVNNAQASSDGTSTIGGGQDQEPDSPGWKRWARIGAAVVGAAGIIAAVFAVLQYVAT
jgi:AbiTii-like protein